MSSLPGEEGRPTLYDWAGGEAALARMIDAFYDRVEADELLAPLFGGGVGVEHRDHVIAWWSEVFGGPARYSDELGGYPRMVRKHIGLGITAEQRHRFASLMSLAADDAALPDDPEFRAALVGYLEWGPASPWPTPRRGRAWCRMLPSRAGAGESLRPISRTRFAPYDR